jgi:hypothetical protein
MTATHWMWYLFCLLSYNQEKFLYFCVFPLSMLSFIKNQTKNMWNSPPRWSVSLFPTDWITDMVLEENYKGAMCMTFSHIVEVVTLITHVQILNFSFYFLKFFIHLFTCAYIVWTIPPPCPLVLPPNPAHLQQNLFCTYL